MILTNKAVSPKGKLNREDLETLFDNVLKFSGPTLALFFAQLAMGVEFKKAWPIALFSLYQAISDFFSKLNANGK
jgi:hypothetical protein